MRNATFREAINEAMRHEMERDETVVLIGEDVRGGEAGSAEQPAEAGGVLGVTKGLWTQFGSTRVIDTPISEGGFMGMAAGAAISGMRPIAELMFADFFGVCYDALYNQAAKFRYMFGGKAECPLVVRTMIGAGMNAASQHSQSPYNVFASTPGLKVVVPSNPYDAKGLLIEAIRDQDPVVFCEHKILYDLKGEVPEEDYTIPFGVANTTREGDDVTIIAIAAMAHKANAVADKLAKEGISVEVIDPRTISPLDEEAILESVENTGRLVVVDESAARVSLAHDIVGLVTTNVFSALKAQPAMVLPPHTPIPFTSSLEKLWIPDEADIEAAVRRVMGA